MELDIYTKKRIIRSLHSMEKFSEKIRRSVIRLLARNKTIIKFRSNREISFWEIGQMNYFMRIFPMVNIAYDKDIVIIMRK